MPRFLLLNRDLNISLEHRSLYRKKIKEWLAWYIPHEEKLAQRSLGFLFRREKVESDTRLDELKEILTAMKQLENRISGTEAPVESLVVVKEPRQQIQLEDQ